MLRNCETTSGVVRSSGPDRYASRNCDYVGLGCFNCTGRLYEPSTTHRCAAHFVLTMSSIIASSQCSGTIVASYRHSTPQFNNVPACCTHFLQYQRHPFAVLSCLLGLPGWGRSLKPRQQRLRCGVASPPPELPNAQGAYCSPVVRDVLFVPSYFVFTVHPDRHEVIKLVEGGKVGAGRPGQVLDIYSR